LTDLKAIYLEYRRTTNNVRFALASESAEVFRLLAQRPIADAKRIEAGRTSLKKHLDEASEQLQKIDVPGTHDEDALLRTALAEIALLARKADEALDAATGDVKAGVAAMESADAQYRRAIDSVTTLGKFINGRADALIEQAQADAALATWIIWITV